LFDKDGTLADVQRYLWQVGEQRIRRVEVQVPGVQDGVRRALGLSQGGIHSAGLMAVGTRRETAIATAACVAATGRDWITALNLVESAFTEADQTFRRKADHTPLLPGCLDLLQRLAKTGVRIGILSSDTTGNVVDFVERHQLNDLIQVCLGAMEDLSKPDPRLLYHACELLGAAAERTLVVGDSLADIQMARAAGVGCVGVLWGWSQPPDLSQADGVVGQPADLAIQ